MGPPVPPEIITEAVRLGATKLGENRPQELVSKHGQIVPEPEWHMIGHLQTNKVKQIIDKTAMIQSLDSLKLAAEIDKRAKQINIIINVLIEINIANENTKNGVKPKELQHFVENMFIFSNIRMRGLMCVPPFVQNADNNRVYFEKMLKLSVDNKKNILHNYFTPESDMILSMGMSNDYMAAIQEGANMVRIGSALFGARHNTKEDFCK